MIPESLIGVLLGCLTGLIPGIHPNTIASFYSSASSEEAVLLVSMLVTHTFLNIIPATFVGVPEEDTALTIFPAHELVNRGEGGKAISISAFSSLLSVILSIPLFYVVAAISSFDLSFFYKFAIIFALIFFLRYERDPFGGSLSTLKRRVYFFAIFLLSGLLGLKVLDAGDFYFPLLTGLFATPMLVQSLKSEKIVEQKVVLSFPNPVDVAKGVLAGFIVSIFPGISSGVATGVASANSKSPESYISSISSANTSAAILSLAMLHSGKVRSGVADALRGARENLFVLPLFILVAAIIATAITLLLTFPASKIFSKVKVGSVSLLVLIFLVALSFHFNGILGLAVFFSASAVGLISYTLKVRPIACMGSIMLPVLIR